MGSDALRVLVVDDSPIIGRRIRMLLDQIGYRVVMTAENGREAIAAYQKCWPDVVTMDISMPVMDGLEATRNIIQMHPQANIVMVTSHRQKKMVLAALASGAKGYVLKPFQPKKVSEVIDQAYSRVVLKDKLDVEFVKREQKSQLPVTASDGAQLTGVSEA